MNFKNVFIAMLVSCTLYVSAFAGDFGSVNFGMTKDEVKVAEKASTLTSESEDELIFSEASGNNKAQNVYVFEEGKLAMAITVITTEHKDGAGYVNDFKTIDEYWTSVKGKPSETSIDYVEDYKGAKADLSNPAALGSAILEGNAACITTWENENITITHALDNAATISEMDRVVEKILANAKVGHVVMASVNSGEYDGDDLEEEGGEGGEGEEE